MKSFLLNPFVDACCIISLLCVKSDLLSLSLSFDDGVVCIMSNDD